MGRLITIMAFPTSHFSAQLSMYVIKIITQTCSDIISVFQLQKWPGSCWNRPKRCWQSWHHYLLKDSSLLPPSGSSHICALVSAVWLGLPRLDADSNMCCGLGSSPKGCCPHVVKCLAVDVCRWYHLLGFAGFPAAILQSLPDTQNPLGSWSFVIWCLWTIYVVFDSGLRCHQLMIATTED